MQDPTQDPVPASDATPNIVVTQRTGARRRVWRWAAAAMVALTLIGVVVAGSHANRLSVGAAAGTAAVPPRAAQAAAPAPPPVAQAAPNNATGSSVLQASLIAASKTVGPAVVSVRTDQGLGSGVIYDASGLLLTNAHVVESASSITIGLADGRHLLGRVLGADPRSDIAVVKIDGQSLPTAPLGESAALKVGQFVIAIGNPYGFDHTVTTGVVSAMQRPVSEGQGSYAQPMIQTSAAINPGNSGGPLVDLQGSVVGITTLIAAPQGFPAQGLGFAIPVDTAKRIAPQLAQDGRVSHSGQPYLGVRLGDLPNTSESTTTNRTALRGRPAPTGADQGALIGLVEPNSPAANAGLRAGDVINGFDGRDVSSADDCLQDLVLHQPGDQVSLAIARAGQPLTVSLTVGEAKA